MRWRESFAAIPFRVVFLMAIFGMEMTITFPDWHTRCIVCGT